MEKKLKIGVFGGARGHTMMNVLFAHPHAELVAVCDKYQPLLDRVSEEAKARLEAFCAANGCSKSDGIEKMLLNL